MRFAVSFDSLFSAYATVSTILANKNVQDNAKYVILNVLADSGTVEVCAVSSEDVAKVAIPLLSSSDVSSTNPSDSMFFAESYQQFGSLVKFYAQSPSEVGTVSFSVSGTGHASIEFEETLGEDTFTSSFFLTGQKPFSRAVFLVTNSLTSAGEWSALPRYVVRDVASFMSTLLPSVSASGVGSTVHIGGGLMSVIGQGGIVSSVRSPFGSALSSVVLPYDSFKALQSVFSTAFKVFKDAEVFPDVSLGVQRMSVSGMGVGTSKPPIASIVVSVAGFLIMRVSVNVSSLFVSGVNQVFFKDFVADSESLSEFVSSLDEDGKRSYGSRIDRGLWCPGISGSYPARSATAVVSGKLLRSVVARLGLSNVSAVSLLFQDKGVSLVVDDRVRYFCPYMPGFTSSIPGLAVSVPVSLLASSVLKSASSVSFTAVTGEDSAVALILSDPVADVSAVSCTVDVK